MSGTARADVASPAARGRWAAAMLAVVLTLLASGQGSAAAGPESYNPKDDPNYAREVREKAVSWERALSSIAEFEASAPSGPRRPAGPPLVAPQSPAYTGPPAGTVPPVPDASPYGPYGLFYPPYGDPFWGPAWRRDSPRIPWWSLLPLTRHDLHRRDVIFPWHLLHK